jgi:hypothetical protein
MGLLAATVTKQYLIAYKNDIEYKMNLIRQSKMGLSEASGDLLHAGTDLDPENPVIKQLEERKARLNLLEKRLDMQLDEYQTKLQMIDKNIEACDETIKGAIK